MYYQTGRDAQMRNEIASAPARALLVQGGSFTRVETHSEITSTIQQLHAAGCRHIALVAIHLLYKPTRVLFPMEERAQQSSISLLQHIRPLVRRSDYAFLYRHSCYFVLRQANLQGAQIVEERLWEALLWRVHNMHEYELVRPTGLAIGHGAFPDPHCDPDGLVRAAGECSKHFPGHADYALSGHVVQEQARATGQEELSKLARKLGIPYLVRLPHRLPQRVLHIVSARLARELRCYPLGRARNTLTVAMLDPQDHQALERLHQETGLHIFPVLTHPEALERALRQFS
jgi:hypothetical protein